jgi:hypothetical protein
MLSSFLPSFHPERLPEPRETIPFGGLLFLDCGNDDVLPRSSRPGTSHAFFSASIT